MDIVDSIVMAGAAASEAAAYLEDLRSVEAAPEEMLIGETEERVHA
jgi:hypothetical protein